jgi:DNA-binding NarL/FixJ family response regulator
MRSCLICDDHVMMREALAGAVSIGWPHTEIIQVADFPAAWSAAGRAPSLIICDLVMPGAAPIEGIRRLREAAPHSPILVVTGNEQDEVLLALFDLGISGFAPKTSKAAIIDAAIRLALAGGRYAPPRIVELAARRGQTGEPPSTRIAEVRLTERQIDILKMIATGDSNKQIARALELSPATIKAHIAAAIGALAAVNRTEAVVKAREMGLI